MNTKYILEGKTPVPCNDLLKWGEFFNDQKKRRVAYTELGAVHVSTVFLGLDHGWGGRPLLFETMVFGGNNWDECERYSTWEEAEQGHQRMVQRVVAAGAPIQGRQW